MLTSSMATSPQSENYAALNVLESENYAECVHTGKYARIIDGHFATVRAGQRTEKKVTIKTLKEPLSGGHDALFVC